ncbi:MAG: D-alanine--D-alanine ligase [Acidimicrobiales bacterium]|nr:MAG: hypothetical protein EDR02_07775 [Actinomycetota bacterium]MBV6509914.1 D-alanine--D-alanine ligase [Acidimicrobiales bacterium]RIK08593.1 MAG: hypothetical protein DCC48_01230 [Acidobacteriota bacterium]
MSSVAVVFGGPSPEHDISILTGLQAARVLLEDGIDVQCIYWSKTAEWLGVPADLEAADFLDPVIRGASELSLSVPGGFSEVTRRKDRPLGIEVVLNCCHGGPGEDGTLAGMLATAGLRVTGPSPEASALCMDKLATAGVATGAGVEAIPTVSLREATAAIALPTPWVVKPRFGGSSLGVEAGVVDLATATALAASGASRAGAVAQPYLEDWVDLNIAVRTYPELSLSAIERPLRSDEGIYDYRGKYLSGGEGMESAPRELPARLPTSTEEKIRAAATSITDTFGLTGCPRIDFLWDGAESLRLCEINSIPGALGMYLWSAAGIPRAQLLGDLLTEARESRPWRPQWSASSDGTALRIAGSVAQKLT